MGYDILSTGSQKDFFCNNTYWSHYINVAIAFGWEPKGTYHRFDPGEEERFGRCNDDKFGENTISIANGTDKRSLRDSYFSNDRQRVSDEDAHAMGVALNRAIEAIKLPSKVTDDQYWSIWAFIGVDPPMTDEKRKQIDEGLAHLVVRLQELADVANAGEFKIC